MPVGELGPQRLALDARHTFASLARAAGTNVSWVSTQPGHAKLEVTLQIGTHAVPDEPTDLEFLDFRSTKRHQTSPRQSEPPTTSGTTLQAIGRETLIRSTRQGLNRRPSAWEADTDASDNP